MPESVAEGDPHEQKAWSLYPASVPARGEGEEGSRSLLPDRQLPDFGG